MAKAEQILTIEPQNELRFRGPFNVPVTSYMKLSNPSDKKVMFKIKTTAPKKYCVRPNSGTIEPHDSTEIAICLQPFLFDPAEKNKHKFMVQTVFAPDDPQVNFEQFWKSIPADQLMDSKLKCVFEMPAEQNEAQAGGGEEANVVSHKAANYQASAPNANNSNNYQKDLFKAEQEIQQLREDESFLRQENLKLREELYKYKKLVSDMPSSSGPINKTTSSYMPPALGSGQSTNLFVIIGIVMAIFGIILGKFIL